jgi:hypothetical protein
MPQDGLITIEQHKSVTTWPAAMKPSVRSTSQQTVPPVPATPNAASTTTHSDDCM